MSQNYSMFCMFSYKKKIFLLPQTLSVHRLARSLSLSTPAYRWASLQSRLDLLPQQQTISRWNTQINGDWLSRRNDVTAQRTNNNSQPSLKKKILPADCTSAQEHYFPARKSGADAPPSAFRATQLKGSRRPRLFAADFGANPFPALSYSGLLKVAVCLRVVRRFPFLNEGDWA